MKYPCVEYRCSIRIHLQLFVRCLLFVWINSPKNMYMEMYEFFFLISSFLYFNILNHLFYMRKKSVFFSITRSLYNLTSFLADHDWSFWNSIVFQRSSKKSPSIQISYKFIALCPFCKAIRVNNVSNCYTLKAPITFS